MSIIAKYSGTCAATGARILPGDEISYKNKRPVLLTRKTHAIDQIILNGEHGARAYYQNARGRCIDAPCCGCCTL